MQPSSPRCRLRLPTKPVASTRVIGTLLVSFVLLLVLGTRDAVGALVPQHCTPADVQTFDPDSPCNEQAWEACWSERQGLSQNETACVSQARQGTGSCALSRCDLRRVNESLRCMRFLYGCSPFRSPTDCPRFIRSLDPGGDCGYVPSDVCGTHRTQAFAFAGVSLIPELTPAFAVGDVALTRLQISPNCSVVPAKYIVNRSKESLLRFDFDVAVFNDGLALELDGVSTATVRVVYTVGESDIPVSRLHSYDSTHLGFVAGFAAARSTSTKNVAFITSGLEPQRHYALVGFFEGVRAHCPDCRVFLQTHRPSVTVDWFTNRSIDAAVFVDTPVLRGTLQRTIVIRLPGELVPTTIVGADVAIIASLDMQRTIATQLRRFVPGYRKLDWRVPGAVEVKFADNVSLPGLVEMADLVFTTHNYDLGTLQPGVVRGYMGSQATWIAQRATNPIGDGGGCSGDARWVAVGRRQQTFVAVDASHQNFSVRTVHTYSNVDMNGVVGVEASEAHMLPRQFAAVAAAPGAYPSYEIYVVFGLNTTAGGNDRLGDIWQLTSSIDDFSTFTAERIYSLVSAADRDPTQFFPTNRYAHTADITTSGLMYVFGGIARDDAPLVTNDLSELDLRTMSWREIEVDDVAGRGYHRSALFEATTPAGIAIGGDKRDTLALFVGFGTAWRQDSPKLEVIGLTRNIAAKIELPRYLNGTAIVEGSRDEDTCMTSTGAMLYIAEARRLTPSSSIADFAWCKYDTIDGAWDGCRTMRLDLGGSKPSKCGVAVDPQTPSERRALLLFAAESTTLTVSDATIACDTSANQIPSRGGWRCVQCLSETYASGSDCLQCSDAARDSSSVARRFCEGSTTDYVTVLVIALVLSVAACVAVASGFFYWRSLRHVRSNLSANELAEELAKAIASGYLVPILYLQDLARPNRMQRSVINIMRLFEVFAQFLPGWVFRGDRVEADFDDDTSKSIASMTMSTNRVQEPAYSRARLLSKSSRSKLKSEDSADAEMPAPLKLTPRTSRRRGRTSDRPDTGVPVEDESTTAMLYRPRLLDNKLFNADVSVVCIKIDTNFDSGEAVEVLDKILSAICNTVDDGMGIVEHLYGDQLMASFNGVMSNPHHVRDAATCVCILAESLDALGGRSQYGLARGMARVGLVNGMFGQRSALIGDVAERAMELTVANRVFGSQALCDWAAGNYLGSTFALRLLGNWVRSPTHRYLVAEVLGMAQNDDAAVWVQQAVKEQDNMMNVRLCTTDYAAHNDLLVAVERGDDRHRDLLIQQCRLSGAVTEREIALLLRTGLPQFTQESSADPTLNRTT